ncbi:MAG: nucleotidyltransferase family protein [Caulobacteraceae bacterium]
MSSAVPKVAMVLAAGLGTRMRPLTLTRPKALVELGGRPLIDHVLARLAEAGIERVVVNVHAFAEALEAHLLAWRDRGLDILVSDEREALLDTGGALAKARILLGDAPLVVANIDSIWTEEPGGREIDRLAKVWAGERMDALLLLSPVGRSLGFSGPGDFFLDRDGRLTHRGSLDAAPYAYAGVQILSPAVIEAWPSSRHSIFPHWMEMASQGRLYGAVMGGRWMHVGDPAALAAAEAEMERAA